jgi:undecaprenyl diphosphate synthase
VADLLVRPTVLFGLLSAIRFAFSVLVERSGDSRSALSSWSGSSAPPTPESRSCELSHGASSSPEGDEQSSRQNATDIVRIHPPLHPTVGLYDRYLALRLPSSGERPNHVALVITERDLLGKNAYATLETFLGWAFEYSAEEVSLYVSVLDEAVVPTLERELGRVTAPRQIAVRGPSDTERADAPIRVSIGLGGKHEFASAVRSLSEAVVAGDLRPEEIDEADVEANLVFPESPDLVIKTGAERLSDFMIWQSVYSELYFTDVNWRDFRRRDYLRALIDFADRKRRFGR